MDCKLLSQEIRKDQALNDIYNDEMNGIKL